MHRERALRRSFRACISLAVFGLALLEPSDCRSAEPAPAAAQPVAPAAPHEPPQPVAPAAPSEPPQPVAPPPVTPSVSAEDPHASNEATSPAAQRAPAERASGDRGSGLFEQSQTNTESAAAAATESHTFDLNGYARGDVFVGKVPGFSQGEIKAIYGEVALELDVKPQPYGDAHAEIRLRHGLQGDERDLIVDLREAYVNAYLGPLDLRLGRQIVVWGRADAFNPTNNLTPLDWRVRSPAEDDRRMANAGARASLALAPMRIEAVWMPLYVPTELPSVVLPEIVTFAESDYPEPELTKGLGAARVHLELAAFEASVSYLYGYAPLPGLALGGFTTGDGAAVRVARTAYDHHVLGLDFSTAIADYLAIRGEAAYRRPLHHQRRLHAPNPDLQYVLGLDRAFGDLNVIVQYLGRHTFDWQRAEGPEEPVTPDFLGNLPDEPGPFVTEGVTTAINQELAVRNQMLFSQTAEIQHLASLRLEWKALHETLSLSALTLVNFTSEEWLLYPKVAYALSDDMSASLGAEIYAGPDETLFGLIEQELSAVYAELRFGF